MNRLIGAATSSITATTFFSTIGALWCLGIGIKWARFLGSLYLPGHNLLKRYERAGNWAVITGGSEGIGFSMAIDLAKRGFNVVLIALDEPRLYDAAAHIRRTSPNVQAIAIPFNFLTADDAAYDELFKQLDKNPNGILVNNVGGFYNYCKPVDVAKLSEDLRLLKLNIEPQVRMTKHFLPRFKELRCGGIVNLSSFSAVTPAPYLTTYAGTKAFNLAFGRSLAEEVAEFHIDVLVVTPLFVSTRITQGYEEKPMEVGDSGTVDPRVMARHTLNKLGSVDQTCGHNFHDWIGFSHPLWAWIGRGEFLKTVKQKFVEQNALEKKAAAAA
ncbi:short chain dehydrogenase, putative [Bodo saltans]|uniref:Short chain dehydrogenase, putative n=1 Tax=Bodo saltans TaxID=75058 RepID=A0A0S4JBE7_BODSA|nr:short chain dehydrogenase, putative [Bodo saltans]|eukprot:CUG88717.1 short chain dehydrogenase, putative [Bodo saltans]